ncbi:ras guanine nucleotide exchange factor R isoform X5 [Drosophila montana]|uniref:ras guanine nucleotide exchange factor R isoform X5 n=1 Tax=Drosophila montana TaxID=40370 RepID=UPI00313BC56C
MDSEAVTKLSETENSQLVKESKENVPTEATGTTNDENEEVASVEDSTESQSHTEIKTTTTIVTTKKDNGDEAPLTETQTTTTVVLTKKDSGEGTETQKETETTSSTVVVAKKADGLETKTTDNVSSVENGQIKAETKESQPVKPEPESKPITETADNTNKSGSQSSIPDISTDAAEQNVSLSERKAEEEESEEGDSTSDEEELGEETKTEAKIEKNKDDQDESHIVSQPEVVVAAAEVKKTQDSVEKANNANKDINNQIENIISDIDINIKAQEKITQLKEQELQLIQKQKELANQIQQQQLLAQKLFAQNQLKEQELKAQQYQQNQLKEQELRSQQYQQNQLKEQELRAQQYQQQQQQQQLKQFQSHNEYKEEIAPKVAQDYTKVYGHQEDAYDKKESSNLSRTVDLRKIFTPATDAPEILPKNRKLYASSAFYSPSLHPTVEDQVELARRISHSLSDISNHTSKGQSMYVNRKKRSVKWVHEGSGQEIEEDDIIETRSLSKENTEEILKPDLNKLEKMPLKLVMNPRGQMRDYNSLKESINVESGLLSPDNCAELITALQLHKGRGAELFAKRRRKAENWVVDETNAGIHSPSGIPDYQQYQARPATSPSILPAYSDAGKHRVQLNLHQDQLIEKYSKPGVQVVKSPWEAALQTGSASAAFLEDSRYQNQTPIASQASPVHFNQDLTDSPSSIAELPSRQPASLYAPSNNVQDPYKNLPQTRGQSQPNQQPCNPQRELAYKPSVAQGWGGRNVELPRGLYVPKEISLASYAPPPVQLGDHRQQTSNFGGPTKGDFSQGYHTSHAGETPSGFPISNPTSGLYSSVPPKQQLYAPASYQKVPPGSVQAGPQVNFSPSPLSFDKLSKFQESDQRNAGASNQRYLNVNKQPAYTNVRNASPTPFSSGGIGNRAGFDNIQRSPFASTPSNSTLPQLSAYGQNAYSPESHQLRAPGPGQCFNNSARGWSQASNTQRNSNVLCSRVPVATEGLPYSDF